MAPSPALLMLAPGPWSEDDAGVSCFRSQQGCCSHCTMASTDHSVSLQPTFSRCNQMEPINKLCSCGGFITFHFSHDHSQRIHHLGQDSRQSLQHQKIHRLCIFQCDVSVFDRIIKHLLVTFLVVTMQSLVNMTVLKCLTVQLFELLPAFVFCCSSILVYCQRQSDMLLIL